jgi:hypothetical protein
VLSFVDRAGREHDRRSRSVEKRFRIAFGQQLSRALAHLGGDEHELRVQLPRLDVPVPGPVTLV